MPGTRRLVPLLLAAIAFGVVMAVIKGQETGARDALGNLSAPWALLPFLAGTRCRGPLAGALVGVLTTSAAFLGFYSAEAAILDLGSHPWYVDLRLTLGSGHVYELWGTVSGLAFGALGAVWATSRSALAGVAVGLVFVCEPAIVWVLKDADVWGGGGLFEHAWIWIGEILLGLGAILVILRQSRAPRSSSA
jgi:hypothetical protein